MQIMKLPLEALKLPEKNVRIHTERQVEEFARSVDMFGQIRPVVVDENNLVLAGNGLVAALKKAGKNEADVYQICGLSENQKKKLMIADNKIFNLGIDNIETLDEFLRDLGNDLDVPGYDEEILQTMVAQAEDVTAKICEYGSLDTLEIERIQSRGQEEENAGIAHSMPENSQTISREQQTEPMTTVGIALQEKNFVVCPKCGEKIWL